MGRSSGYCSVYTYLGFCVRKVSFIPCQKSTMKSRLKNAFITLSLSGQLRNVNRFLNENLEGRRAGRPSSGWPRSKSGCQLPFFGYNNNTVNTLLYAQRLLRGAYAQTPGRLVRVSVARASLPGRKLGEGE